MEAAPAKGTLCTKGQVAENLECSNQRQGWGLRYDILSLGSGKRWSIKGLSTIQGRPLWTEEPMENIKAEERHDQ